MTDNSIPVKGRDNNSLVNTSPPSSSSLLLIFEVSSSNNSDSNSYNDESSNERVGLEEVHSADSEEEARVVVEMDEIDSFVITRSNVGLLPSLLLLLLRGR